MLFPNVTRTGLFLLCVSGFVGVSVGLWLFSTEILIEQWFGAELGSEIELLLGVMFSLFLFGWISIQINEQSTKWVNVHIHICDEEYSPNGEYLLKGIYLSIVPRVGDNLSFEHHYEGHKVKEVNINEDGIVKVYCEDYQVQKDELEKTINDWKENGW